MAQGQHKQKSVGQIAQKSSQKVNKRISRGIRIAPKSMAAIKEKSMQKKLNAKNVTNTERQMSVKAAATGKLTIMKGVADQVNKEKKEKEIAAEKKAKATVSTSGSSGLKKK